MELTTFLWMFLVLKIPIAAALVLIWWAIKEPEPAAGEDGDGGLRDPGHRPQPRLPGPRGRGPHGVHPVGAPRRVRVAIGRRLTRHGR